jgi:predicted transcriptional regulator
MPKEAVFTMKLEPELCVAFMAEAEHRPASQVMRDLMRQYIERQRESRVQDEYQRDKVKRGRAEMLAGQGRSNKEVDTRFAARRAKVTTKA